MGIRPQIIPPPNSQIFQDVLEQTETIFRNVRKNAMQAYIKYKAYCDRKANASKLKKPITSLYYSRKQITKGVKIPLQTFAGSGHLLLKRCYPTINIWYAKSALTERKFYIE